MRPDTRLPMIYIDDCIQGIVKLIEAPKASLTERIYNINAVNFTPEEISQEINKHYKDEFNVSFQPDFRQAIADSWPCSLDDNQAKKDWGWDPKINTIQKLAKVMLGKLTRQP